MSEKTQPAVAGPVEPTVRRPLGMPEYTAEQKAAAFDALWGTCGLGMGALRDYVSRNISRPGTPDNEATLLRVPRYEFTILAEGEMQSFSDVLHHLATRRVRQQPTGPRPKGIAMSEKPAVVAPFERPVERPEPERDGVLAELDDEDPLWLVNEQIKGLLEGDGATDDHEDVLAFLRATGLPEGTVTRMHRALVGGLVDKR